MTNELRERLLAEQVRAMATVILTRRPDLTILDTRENSGLDLHVHVGREEKSMRLTFGVLLRAVYSPATSEQANKILGPTMGEFTGMRKFTYPVCLFFFTTRDEQAYFSWLAEPVLNNNTPKLVHREKADCLVLTTELLDSVVERVVAWYDAVEAVLIA